MVNLNKNLSRIKTLKDKMFSIQTKAVKQKFI